ncbi:hypothetical protein EDB81DRAFT_767037 [Dactylonectria macrodidyma]|uniref:Uncharacterized protein n=1 Tax=Dactylonectria macrodidyma TaxID=307937 RepID=A0A9P9DFV6_9HYPO|nr:hypothetical protein EDB81DRAFT_767037 [Dactylonectria macrodidyma]
MAEPDPPPSLLQIRAMEECVSQVCQHLEDTKSPHLLYQEQVAVLKDSVEQEWARVSSNLTRQDLTTLQQSTLKLGGQLRELELKHAATIKEDDKAYRASLEAQVRKLCRDMVDIFGRSLVTETLQECPTEPVPGLRSPANGPLAPTDATSQEHTQSASQHNATDTPPNVESQDANMQEPDSTEDQTTPTNSSISINPKKRMGSVVSGKQKRARVGQTEPAETKRTIEFDEVFQDGNAAIKHTIVQFRDEWYILLCDEHGLSFKHHPIMSAAKHLNGRAHGKLPKDHEMAIKHLGVRVLNCSAKLAEENNRVCLVAYRTGYEPSKLRTRTKNNKSECIHVSPLLEQTDQHVDTPLGNRGSACVNGRGKSGRRPRKQFDGIVDPTPGGIYLGYWSKSREWQAVLVLPGVATEQPIDIGFSGTIQDLGLTEQLPQCYTYDPQTGILDWQEGYKDGGPLVTERQFPVMYFDGLDFPSESSVGWVAANDLQSVDTQDSNFELTPHFKSVLNFLETQRSKQVENSNLENMEQTELRLGPADIDTLDSTVVTAPAALPAEQSQEEQSNPQPGLSQNNCQSDDQEAPLSSEEGRTNSVAGLPSSRADFRHNPSADPKTHHENQNPNVVAVNSDFSSNAASAAATGTPPAGDRPEPVISPSMSLSVQPVTAPTPDNQGERDSPLRNRKLLQMAADGCRLNGWLDQDGPSAVEEVDGTRTAASRQSRISPLADGPIHPSQTHIAPGPLRFQAKDQGKDTESPPIAMQATERTKIDDQRLNLLRQPHSAEGPTSFHKEHPHTSNVVSNDERDIQAGPPQGPGSSPLHQSSFVLPVPRNLNLGLTVPAMYQLRPLNPMPPNQTTPQPFPQSQLTDNTHSVGCQEPILSPDYRLVTLPPLSIPSMSTRPSLQPHSVGN